MPCLISWCLAVRHEIFRSSPAQDQLPEGWEQADYNSASLCCFQPRTTSTLWKISTAYLCSNSYNLQPNIHSAKLWLHCHVVCLQPREVARIHIYTHTHMHDSGFLKQYQAPYSIISWPTPPCCLQNKEMTELSHRDSTSQGSKYQEEAWRQLEKINTFGLSS